MAEQYLERNHVHELLRGAVSQLLTERPVNVCHWLSRYFAEKSQNVLDDSSAGASETQKRQTTRGQTWEELALQSDEASAKPSSLQASGRQLSHGRRGAISCEPIDSSKKLPTMKIVKKSPEALEQLQKAVSKNIMFSHLDPEERSQVFDVMFEVRFRTGDVIINQGDEGDYFYVVQEGEVKIFVASPGDPFPGKLYVTNGPGTSFGELALIYGSPRAATCIAATDVVLWAIDRSSYRRILMETTINRRKLNEKFLENVPLLASLSRYERITVADALEVFNYQDNEVIIRQGDPGDRFFIIVSGECRVVRTKNGIPEEMPRLKPGNYFGEIALLTNRTRAATVIAVGSVVCVTVDRERFSRVLGPCENIFRRNMETYNLLMQVEKFD